METAGDMQSSSEDEEEAQPQPARVPSFDLDAQRGGPSGGRDRGADRGSERQDRSPSWARSGTPGEQQTQGRRGQGQGVGASQQHLFNPGLAAEHHYLGDVDELGGSVSLLEEGRWYTLPLFALEGVVLLPGSSLPLLLHTPPDVLKVERAVRVREGPTARLIAATNILHSPRGMCCLVGCSAEVRRLRRQGAAGAGGGVVAVVARGRQRLLLDPVSLRDTFRVRVRVMDEGEATPPPKELSSGCAFWAPWASRPFDAPALARTAQQLVGAVLPQVAGSLYPAGQSSPYSLGPAAVVRYSYWLAANLPLHTEQRQTLLECRTVIDRLRLLLTWLRSAWPLACTDCGHRVALCSHALPMSSEGAGGTFVNAHGFVHDIATFTQVLAGGARCVGRPETEHSWFPGYAWTIANCARCRQHMGWRFTAVEPGLSPREFWGLRRTSITCTRLQLQALQQGEEDTEEPEEDTQEGEEEEGQGMADAYSGSTSTASSSHGDEDTGGEGDTDDDDNYYDGRDSVDEVVQQQETSSGGGSEREDEEGGQEGGTEAGDGDGGPRWPFLQLERWLRRRWEVTEGGRAHRAARAAAAMAGAGGGGGGAADPATGEEGGATDGAEGAGRGAGEDGQREGEEEQR